MMKIAGSERFQFSVRSLLVVTAILALLLVPVVWVARERQQMLRLSESVLQAREEAIRSVILAERQRVELQDSDAAVVPTLEASDHKRGRTRKPATPLEIRVERLERENAELKRTVEIQRQEIERLKVAKTR